MPIKQMFPPLKKKLDDALRDTGETGEIGETGTGIRGPRKPKKTTKSNRPQGCWHRPVNYSRTFELISHFNIFNILHIFTLTVCKTSALGPYLLSGCNKAERFLFFFFVDSSEENMCHSIFNLDNLMWTLKRTLSNEKHLKILIFTLTYY